eukprot:8219679-Pyramimonas_sp.AAC.1
MKRSEAVSYMQILGYEQVPADIPGIKAYKAKTKQRMLEIARLIIVAVRAGKTDQNHYIKEVTCLKYMMSTAERLVDPLADFKIKRDKCQTYLKTMMAKINEMQI